MNLTQSETNIRFVLEYEETPVHNRTEVGIWFFGVHESIH